jgi:hypothetical protein
MRTDENMREKKLWAEADGPGELPASDNSIYWPNSVISGTL